MGGVSGVGPSHGGIPPQQKPEPTKEIDLAEALDFLQNYTWKLAATIARLEKG